MRLIVCVEDQMGMLFHQRRVSRDREVIRDIVRLCQGQPLRFTGYSAKLFDGMCEPSPELVSRAAVCEHAAIHLQECEASELWDTDAANLFVENPADIIEEKVDAIVLYRWNRRYPADQYFPIDLRGWELTGCSEFPGYSHDKITRECYKRKAL
jgi:hypothetical protein